MSTTTPGVVLTTLFDMRPRRPTLLDALLALALVGLTIATLVPGTSAPALALAILAVAPVALRQRAPVATLLVVAAALAAYTLLGYGAWPTGALGLVVAIFTAATLRPPGAGLVTLPAVAVVVLLPRVRDATVSWPEVVQALLVLGCAWAVGDGTRRWSSAAQAAAARAERLVAEERIRIARELHDVVAHHMSVVALQTGVASYVLDTDPATARDAVTIAGSASREALQEMGHLLDALRTDEGSTSELAPQPGLAELDDLVARMREVGIDVRLRRRGSPWPLSTGLELCVFRVVQESLTNVLRHAGPGSSAEVTLEYDERLLVVEVVDDGRGAGGRTVGAGRGIRGMRERAELYAGTLDAGPRPSGGFAVRIEVPTEPPARAVLASAPPTGRERPS